jgi:hypothetical protein
MFTENEIIAHLEALAPLGRMFVSVEGGIDPGLICYVTDSGQAFFSMDDDDKRNEAAINFLKNRGNPVVHNDTEFDFDYDKSQSGGRSSH